MRVHSNRLQATGFAVIAWQRVSRDWVIANRSNDCLLHWKKAAATAEYCSQRATGISTKPSWPTAKRQLEEVPRVKDFPLLNQP